MSFDLNLALATQIVCQKRTGKHKQFVFVNPVTGQSPVRGTAPGQPLTVDLNEINGQIVGGPTVTKGPFSADRAQLILNRSNQLRTWGLPFVVHPQEVIIGNGLKGEPAYYIVYPNLAEGYPISCELYTESMVNYQNQHYSYRILNRVGLVKLGDVITQIDWLNDPFIGQSPIRGEASGQPSTVDSFTGQSPVRGLASGQPLTLAAWLMISLIGLSVLDVGDMHFANILADLSRHTLHIIDYDDTQTERKTGEIFYLKMTPAKDKLAKWLGLVRPWYGQITLVLESLTNDPNYGPRFREAIQMISGSTTDVNQLTNLMSNMNLGTGQMAYRGPFNATTYSGLSTDIVKSALQKYIRRNIPEKAIIAAFELYRMGEIEKGESVRSNLYNRIAIIAAEDIGPANLSLVIVALKVTLTKNRDPNLLGALIQTMAGSLKTRLMSHVYRALISPEGRLVAQQKGLQIDDVPTQDDLNSHTIIWQPNDPIEIRPYAEIFKRRLMSRSFTAIIWLGYYLRASEGKKIATRNIRPRRRQTDPVMIICEVIKDFLHPTVWESLIDAYLEITENRPFLMCGIISVLYGISSTGQNIEPYDLTPLYSEWVRTSATERFLTGQYRFEVDDFVIDKHTSAGRNMGLGREKFVSEGARVIPEDSRFVVPAFKEVYEA